MNSQRGLVYPSGRLLEAVRSNEEEIFAKNVQILRKMGLRGLRAITIFSVGVTALWVAKKRAKANNAVEVTTGGNHS